MIAQFASLSPECTYIVQVYNETSLLVTKQENYVGVITTHEAGSLSPLVYLVTVVCVSVAILS